MKLKTFLLIIQILVPVLLVKANDTARVIQLNNKASHAMISDQATAKGILEKALIIAVNMEYYNGIILTHKNLGKLYFHLKKYKESTAHYKEALSIAEKSQQATEIAFITLQLGKIFNLTGDKESALFYLDKAVKFFTVTANTDGLHETLQTLSLVHQAHNEYYQALHFGLEALKISRNFENKEKMVLSLGNLGQIYTLLNQKQKALEHYLRAISYAEVGMPSAYLPILYIKTGTLYRETKNLQKSVHYLMKAYELFSRFGNKDGMIASLTEAGITYKLFQQNNKALNFFLRAKTISEQEQNYPRIIALNKEIADLYIQQKNMHKAIIYLEMNFNIAKELQDSKLEAEALMNTGYYYMVAGNNQRAIDLLLQSYAISKQIMNYKLLARITEDLATAYAKSNKHENAYQYLRLSKKYTEHLNMSVENTTFQMLQSVFEITNSQKELELLRKTNEIERLEKQKALEIQKRLIFGMITLIILMIVMAFINTKFRKTNRILKIKGHEIEASNKALLEMNLNLEKQKKELNELNKSLSEANKMLSESEERYKAISATKDRLFSVISHDLRSPFASVVSFVRMMKRDLNTMTKKDIAELTLDLEDTTERINTLLENLLQWSKVQRGRITYTPVTLNLFELTEETTGLFSTNAKNKKIEIKNTLDMNLCVYGDKLMLLTIIRNLLSNAIKFSNSGDEILLSCKTEKNELTFCISDNGKGMSAEQLEAHLSGQQSLIRSGTGDERGSGLGLMICNEFLHFHGSSIQVSPNNGKGAVFHFTLKLCK
jgi:signal transduction histidine kinase